MTDKEFISAVKRAYACRGICRPYDILDMIGKAIKKYDRKRVTNIQISTLNGSHVINIPEGYIEY